MLKSPAGVQVGARIVCPKCRESFSVSAPASAKKSSPPDDTNGEEEQILPRRSPTRSVERTRGRMMDDQEPGGQGEEADRHDRVEAPRRKTKNKRGRRQGAPNLLLLGLIISGMALLLVAGGVSLYFAFRKGSPAASAPVASKPSASSGVMSPSQVEVPPGWEEVVSAQGRFRALIPRPVVERTRTMNSDVGPVKDTQYLRETAGTDLGYSIAYADFSAEQLQKLSLAKLIERGRDAILNKYKGQLEADRGMEREGRQGRELVIRVPGSGRFVMHYYIDGSRLYTLTAAGSAASLDSKEVRAFLDSFHFTGVQR
jgi:hypothetical protein